MSLIIRMFPSVTAEIKQCELLYYLIEVFCNMISHTASVAPKFNRSKFQMKALLVMRTELGENVKN